MVIHKAKAYLAGQLMLLAFLTVGASAEAQLTESSVQQTFPEAVVNRRVHYWDILFSNPRGGEPVCSQPLGTCSNAVPCCSSATKPSECVAGGCCLLDGAECAVPNRSDDNCCSGHCNSSGRCGGGCMSADTLLRVQGVGPVPIAKVRTGQYVQCVKTGDDLMTPRKLDWCLVANWAHAEHRLMPQTRITFTRPATQAEGSLTATRTHRMLRLTQASLRADTQGLSVAEFGSFETVPASTLRPGDLIPVVSDEGDPTSGFTVVAVSSVQDTQAVGMYVPILETPFAIADGVVTPFCAKDEAAWRDIAAAPGLTETMKHAALHYQFAFNFMNRYQANNTAGRDGQWPRPGGSPAQTNIIPINAAKAPHLAAGKSLNFTALQAWFLPRYAAWKNDSSQVITVEDVVAMLSDDAVWVKPPQKKI